MPTQLTFKGDKKPAKSKKRKLTSPLPSSSDLSNLNPTSQSLTTPSSNEIPIEDDDSWTSADHPTDLAGPVIIVLPTEPPSCVATDAEGKIFTLEVENLIDERPDTAEPHDVRMVWVVTRIPGVEGGGGWSFRGHSGKYLSADKFGILSATRDAISPEEQYIVLPAPDLPGTFAIQTQRDKFITIAASTSSTKKSTTSTVSTDIRGDAESIDFNSTLRIRMQARFKPRHKANKEAKAKEKVSRKELEAAVGRTLDEDEVRKLKRARREGGYHEAVLDARVKGKHDKFATF